MRKINADGCLLTVDVNLYYTTGRIYSGYFYLPAEGAPWFFVKRPNGLAGDHVEYIRKPEQMAELFAFYGLEMPEKLLLEADELTYNDYILSLIHIFALGFCEGVSVVLILSSAIYLIRYFVKKKPQ